MENKKLENLAEGKITDEELDAIYLYLNIQMETMTDDERLLWVNILKIVDNEFYDSTGDGSD